MFASITPPATKITLPAEPTRPIDIDRSSTVGLFPVSHERPSIRQAIHPLLEQTAWLTPVGARPSLGHQSRPNLNILRRKYARPYTPGLWLTKISLRLWGPNTIIVSRCGVAIRSSISYHRIIFVFIAIWPSSPTYPMNMTSTTKPGRFGYPASQPRRSVGQNRQ